MEMSPSLRADGCVLSLSKDLIATLEGRVMTAWNILNLKAMVTHRFTADVKGMELSPDSTMIACLLVEKESTWIQAIRLKTPGWQLAIEDMSTMGIESLLWSPDSKYLLAVFQLEMYIEVRSTESSMNERIGGARKNQSGEPLCRFSVDGEYFAVVSGLSDVCIYSSTNWTRVQVLECRLISDICILEWMSDSCSLFLSDSPLLGPSYQCISLTNRTLFSTNSDSALCGVRAVTVSERQLAVALITREIKVYDTLTWRVVATLEHRSDVLPGEYRRLLEVPLKNKKEQFSTASTGSVIRCNEPKELHLKLDSLDEPNLVVPSEKKKQMLSFSHCGQYLASHDPSLPTAVWIWHLTGDILLETLIVWPKTANGFQALQWHPTRRWLAVIQDNSVVLWDNEATGIFFSPLVTSPLHVTWCFTDATIIAVAANNRVTFGFLPDK